MENLELQKEVTVGLIGFGTIGSGVYRLLEDNGSLILQRSGVDIRIKCICDIDPEKVKKIDPDMHVTSNWKEIVENESIDVVIELIGGIEPARSILMESVKRGKYFVTANKKLLAEKSSEIFSLSSTVSSMIGYEAAVGGGIPCVSALKSGLIGNRVKSVTGILNGTTNYIFTLMQDENLSFQDALRDAQSQGFAEADPTFDIEGYDAGHKIAILSMLAYNRKVDFDSITIEGVTKVGGIDMAYAHEMGYVIKLLGISKIVGDKVDIRVHPAMLPEKHPLATVRSEYNAVMFNNDMTGPVTLTGKGAGSLPTASAVISDIVQLVRQEKCTRECYDMDEIRFITADERICRYYIRINTEDRAGILSRISGILAKYNISIASVIQKETNMPHVPLIVMTHEAVEGGVLNAAKEIENLEFVSGDLILIRVEENLEYGP